MSITPKQIILRVFSLILLIALVWSYISVRHYLLEPSTLPLKSIKVLGELKYLDRQQLVNTVASSINGGFFVVDIDAIQKKLEALQWVKSVSIRRQWPDTLTMVVDEQQVFAKWGDKALVNPDGGIFMPDNIEVKKQLILYGPDDEAAKVVALYKTMVMNLKKLDLTVCRLGLDKRGEWVFNLESGLKVLLGKGHNNTRLNHFFKIYAGLVKPTKTAKRIDMRYSHGLSVLWNHGNDADIADRGNT